MSETSKGLFCAVIEGGSSQNNVITKVYSNTNILSAVWFALPIKKLLEYVIQYNEDLNTASIKLPVLHNAQILGSSIEITQELVVGTSIKDIINNFYSLDESKLVGYFKRLIGMQLQVYKSHKNLRIDLNPDNFIINNLDNIYLVDITPPLCVGNINLGSKDLIIQRYLDLSFEICPQIAELINNFIKPLVVNKKIIYLDLTLKKLNNFIDKLIRIAIEAWHNDNLEIEIKDYFELIRLKNFVLRSNNYSLKRLWLVKKLCKKEIDIENFYAEYNDLSLTKALYSQPQ